MKFRFALMAAAMALGAGAAHAQDIVFTDPAGDDDGPGGYIYPTDAVYKKGSFDITGAKVSVKGQKVDFAVTVNSPLEDPWRMGSGFSLQMIFVFIDTKPGGNTDGVPGLNVKFDAADGWEKVVVLSPQAPARVKAEAETKAAAMAKDVVIPARTKGAGKTISGSVDLSALGEGDPSKWGYQVVMQSNEGFPSGNDLMTRRVNEYEGQQRFGGGNDENCDPHVLDILAGSAKGATTEVAAQHTMLAYQCNADGSAKKTATLKMVRR